MKRTFVIAVLTSSLAIPAVAVFAANPNGPNGPANAAPQQAIGGINNQAGNPGQNPNLQGKGAPATNFVQNGGDQRGALGNLASGGPSFSANLKEMHGRLDGQPLGGAVAAPGPAAGGPEAKGVVAEGAPAGGPAVAGAPAGGAVAGGAVAGGVVTEVKTEVKAPEHAAEAANFVFNFCRFRAMRRAFGPGVPPMFMQGNFMQGPPAPFGDLVLVNVGMIEDATPVHGPIYRITMLNESPTPSCHFHVSLIAAIGEMNDSAIVVSVPVRFIAPKATATVDISLPINVMAMGNPGVPFDTLVAAVDSFDELAETNKLNNVATFPRAEIVTVVVKTEGTAAVAVAQGGSATTQVSTTVQSGQAVAAPAVGGAAVVNGAAPVNGAPVSGAPANGAAPAVAPANGGAPAPAVAPAPAEAPAPAQGQPAAPAQGAPAAPAQNGEAALPDLDKVDGASQLLSR